MRLPGDAGSVALPYPLEIHVPAVVALCSRHIEAAAPHRLCNMLVVRSAVVFNLSDEGSILYSDKVVVICKDCVRIKVVNNSRPSVYYLGIVPKHFPYGAGGDGEPPVPQCPLRPARESCNAGPDALAATAPFSHFLQQKRVLVRGERPHYSLVHTHILRPAAVTAALEFFLHQFPADALQ